MAKKDHGKDVTEGYSIQIFPLLVSCRSIDFFFLSVWIQLTTKLTARVCSASWWMSCFLTAFRLTKCHSPRKKPIGNPLGVWFVASSLIDSPSCLSSFLLLCVCSSLVGLPFHWWIAKGKEWEENKPLVLKYVSFWSMGEMCWFHQQFKKGWKKKMLVDDPRTTGIHPLLLND